MSDVVLPRAVTPASAGWTYTGLRPYPAGNTPDTIETGAAEELLLPMRGAWEVHAWVTTGGPERGRAYQLTGREDVWEGGSDALYLPPGWSYRLSSDDSQGVLQVASAWCGDLDAEQHPEPQLLPAQEVVVEHRGQGTCARTIRHYSPRTDLRTRRLLVCEVLTPPGNWSSFPPHKHDEHTATERALEEVYCFDLRHPGSGMEDVVPGYLATGTPSNGSMTCAVVGRGDVICVPRGYHGPAMAPPGAEMYYLNVMAGPAADQTWLITYDPCYGTPH